MWRPFKEDGAVLVESALTLMIFLMLIFGILEAGRLIQVRNLVTEAAREGARFAVSPLHNQQQGTWTLPTHSEIADRVTQLLAAAAIDTEQTSISINSDFPFPGDPSTVCTQVVVIVPYRILTPFVPFGGVTLTAQSVMRNETSN